MFSGRTLSGLPSFKECDWDPFQGNLAVIVNDGSVHFYDQKGEEAQIKPIENNSHAVSIAWCPVYYTLAISWKDGTLSIWDGVNIENYSKPLNSPITILKWHPLLPVLLGACKDGEIVAFDCSSSTITPLFSGRIDNPIEKVVWTPLEDLLCFIATNNGTIYMFEDNKESCVKKVCQCPTPIHKMIVSNAANRLVIFCGDIILAQYTIKPQVSKISQEKIYNGIMPKVIQIKSDVLAYAVDNQITIFRVGADDTVILRATNDTTITSLKFDAVDAMLFATTKDGKLIVHKATMKGLYSKAGWERLETIDIGSQLETCIWSKFDNSFIGLTSGRRPIVVRQLDLHLALSKTVLAWQKNFNTVATSKGSDISVIGAISSISANSDYLMVSSDKKSVVCTIRNDEVIPMCDQFSVTSPFTSMYNKNVIEMSDNGLLIRRMEGTVKRKESLDNISKFVNFCSNGAHFCATDNYFEPNVFTVDIERNSYYKYISNIEIKHTDYKIRQMSISCGGFCVAITVDIYEDNMWKPAPELYLHSPKLDKTIEVQFSGSVPKGHAWDPEDPRLLCVNVAPYSNNYDTKASGSFIYPLFVSDTLEFYKQAPLQIEDTHILRGVDLPNVILSNYNSLEQPFTKVLPQFEGLDSADDESKKALMELNFHLAAGEVDVAFDVIRNINNPGIWRSFAQTCAQMNRVDLVDLCFGKMDDCASAILVNKAKSESNVDAIVYVNTQLHNYADAKKVAENNKRYDLLAKIQQSLAEWNDAVKTVSVYDRIHAKLVAYEHARSLEIKGDIPGAIKEYENSGTAGNELPRLAIQSDNIKSIFNYVAERNTSEVDPKIHLWLARFFEAHNQIEQSLELYQKAGADTDYLRLLCINGDWEQANKFVRRSHKRSVICSYARLLQKRATYLTKEGKDATQVKKQVIELFRQGRQFSQALSYALENEMVDDILSLSFSAPQTTIAKAAVWFEERKELKNAVILYSRCGRMNRALSLCLKHGIYDALDEISGNFSVKTDPTILVMCGKQFIKSERWSKAAQCFALAKQFDIVIKLCDDHNIKLDKKVLQDISEDGMEDAELLKRFALLCEQQGDFLTASKLYLKLKDHLASIKVLIRAGDTNRIIKFAKLFRRRETYILAANYLQTLNAREDSVIFDTIVDYYTKANSLDKLARFYEMSGQTEIDEYQNYSKGLELICRSLEILEREDVKIKNKEETCKMIYEKVKFIRIFVEASEIYKEDPKKAITACVMLIRTKDVEFAVRLDDVYVLMARAYNVQGNCRNAYKILDDLSQSGTNITDIMDIEEIKQIYKDAGKEWVDVQEDDQYDEIDDSIEDIED